MAHVQVRTAEDSRQRLKAAADIENVGEGLVLLGVLQNEVAEEALARSGGTQNEGVSDIPVVQVCEMQGVSCSVFRTGEILRCYR